MSWDSQQKLPKTERQTLEAEVDGIKMTAKPGADSCGVRVSACLFSVIVC